MKYSWDNYAYEDEFVYPFVETREEQIEQLRSDVISGYRTKTIRSGNMLECEIYPIYRKRVGISRAPRRRKTPANQRGLNERNAQKHFVRLINANFTRKDIWVTVTYADKNMPESEEDAERNIQRYIRRLEYQVKKKNLPSLKYVYITEYNDDDEDHIRVHHHIVMNFRDRDLAEEKWDGGSRTQARRLQPDEDFSLSGLGFYLAKDPKGRKRWKASKNLTQPIITVSDGKITKGGAIKIAREGFCARARFERLYRGYEFRDLQASVSDLFSGVYIHVRMRRKEIKGESRRR